MAAAAVESLTSELGAKAQIDAVNRDYIVEPRLGELLVGSDLLFSLTTIFTLIAACVRLSNTSYCRLQHRRRRQRSACYRRSSEGEHLHSL